ncbi:hypothetical protein AKO1_001105 [Acrasis kona]|uniref:TauD/TfdA-like domain-containing protein n=1 Tax=Acrasis kona TaxID=1008807 RepID=A0AAW2ZD37_9EUKA
MKAVHAIWRTEPRDYKRTPSHQDWNKETTIEGQLTIEDTTFPLVLLPSNDLDNEFILQKIEISNEWLDNVLIKHGAILFRNFPVKSPSDFNDFVTACGYHNLPVGGTIRQWVVGNVFSVNEFSPDKEIPFHHEMSHIPLHPNHLFFYCEIPGSVGGETPILLSWLLYDKALKRIPEFINELEEKGVKYVRFFLEKDDPNSAMSRGWKSTYATEDKVIAETKCRDAGGTFEWVTIEDEVVMKTTSAVQPAVRLDNRSGRKVFFNSLIATYMGRQDHHKERRGEVLFGDGGKIDPEHINVILEIIRDITADFKWCAGDVLVIDNKLTMYSRKRFKNPRKIYASLAL